MARPKTLPEEIIARFPGGTFDRIRAVLEAGEDRTSFIRVAVEHELKRRVFEPIGPRHEKHTAEAMRLWGSLFPDQEAAAVEALKLWKALPPELRDAFVIALSSMAGVRRRLKHQKSSEASEDVIEQPAAKPAPRRKIPKR